MKITLIIYLLLTIIVSSCDSPTKEFNEIYVYDGFAIWKGVKITDKYLLENGCFACIRIESELVRTINASNLFYKSVSVISSNSLFSKCKFPSDWNLLSENLRLLWLVNNQELKRTFIENLTLIEETNFWNKILKEYRKGLDKWTSEDFIQFWELVMRIEWGESTNAMIISPQNKNKFIHYYMDPFKAKNWYTKGINGEDQLLFGEYLLNRLLIEEAMDSNIENVLYVSYNNNSKEESEILSDFGNLIFKYTLYKDKDGVKLKKKLLNYYSLFIGI